MVSVPRLTDLRFGPGLGPFGGEGGCSSSFRTTDVRVGTDFGLFEGGRSSSVSSSSRKSSFARSVPLSRIQFRRSVRGSERISSSSNAPS